ncbi:MAG: hypothetical protein MJ099_02860 [Clostridia bacterium]|nr:hypothetical protein [Clostridia bacterium]
MDVEMIRQAYALIGDLTPLKTDCGLICDHACCGTDEDGNGGVYLLPGEREAMGEIGWGIVQDDPFAPMLICNGPCEREKRPLLCRIFPLISAIGKGERRTVKLDRRARAMCPLTAHGLKGLDADFAHRVRDAIRLIETDPEGKAFLEKWEALEAEFANIF